MGKALSRIPFNLGRVLNSTARGVVLGIYGEGKRRYVVTTPVRESVPHDFPLDDTITFGASTWSGDGEPQRGQIVELHHVELFERGWRARSACPILLDNI